MSKFHQKIIKWKIPLPQLNTFKIKNNIEIVLTKKN